MSMRFTLEIEPHPKLPHPKLPRTLAEVEPYVAVEQYEDGEYVFWRSPCGVVGLSRERGSIFVSGTRSDEMRIARVLGPIRVKLEPEAEPQNREAAPVEGRSRCFTSASGPGFSDRDGDPYVVRIDADGSVIAEHRDREVRIDTLTAEDCESYARVGRWLQIREEDTHVLGHGIGERNGRARLSREQARDIRRRAIAGESPSQLAREFGVSDTHIIYIREGRVWQSL